jgi:hypothetical protein
MKITKSLLAEHTSFCKELADLCNKYRYSIEETDNYGTEIITNTANPIHFFIIDEDDWLRLEPHTMDLKHADPNDQ